MLQLPLLRSVIELKEMRPFFNRPHEVYHLRIIILYVTRYLHSNTKLCSFLGLCEVAKFSPSTGLSVIVGTSDTASYSAASTR
jgi:hypothetical protein